MIGFRERLRSNVETNGSCLLVGLDPVVSRLPAGLSRDADGVFEFNRAIIEATSDIVAGYKPNSAFYESLGSAGWDALARTRNAIPPVLLALADAKRGDIGDTAALYARTIFDDLGFDAVTLSPYVGLEGMQPFLDQPDHGSFVVCRTSNRDSSFQDLDVGGLRLYEEVAQTASSWGPNVGLVVGANDVEALRRIRKIAPDVPFLVPGIGAQGADLEVAVAAAMGSQREHALISVSRSIIYASNQPDFAEAARAEAMRLNDEINRICGRPART